MKKILAALTLALFLFSLVVAQGPSIKIGHIGFGENSQQAIFTIHNKGDQLLSGLSIYVDGSPKKNITADLEPYQGIELLLDLQTGQHIVEVKASQGASDSVVVDIASETKIGKVVTPQILLNEFQQPLTIIIVLILALIGIWIFVKKPKL